MFLTGCDGGDCNRDHDHHESCLIYSGLVGTEGTELQTSVVAGAPDETKRRTHDCLSPIIGARATIRQTACGRSLFSQHTAIRKPTIMVDPLRSIVRTWRPAWAGVSLQEIRRNFAAFSLPSDMLE